MDRNGVKGIVINVLKHSPEARRNDKLCYLLTASNITGRNVSSMTLAEWVEDKSMPSTETVRRTRQKVQAEHPELKDPKFDAYREQLEKEWRTWARENSNV